MNLKSLSIQHLERNTERNNSATNELRTHAVDAQTDTQKLRIDEFRQLTSHISEHDPKGGCWEWVKRNYPELWKNHLQFFRSGRLVEARQSLNLLIDLYEAANA